MRAYIGLGSNLGIREQQLEHAVAELHHHPDIRVTGCSSIYETAPVGYVEQGSFLNMVICIETSLAPLKLLQVMLTIEHELGRVREFINGPRTIDLDLLIYEDVNMDVAQLVLPHPRMHERGFVLIPLLELMTAQQDENREIIEEQMKKCEHKDGVVLWREVSWQEELGHFAN